MKIGIDARLYGTKHRGIGRYVKKLVDGLIKHDLINSYVIFLTKDNFDAFKESPKVKKVLLDVKWYSLKEQFLVPRVIKKEKLDLVHFPHFNVPYFFPQKYILTIHDLILNHFPDSRATTLAIWQYKFKLWCYKQLIRRVIKKSACKSPLNDENLLKVVLTYLNDKDPSELRKSSGRRPYIATVIAAQNRAGQDIPHVTTLYPGRLPIGHDGTHYSSEGYIMLGKITASAIEEFYKEKK